jgi:hypothetical protein
MTYERCFPDVSQVERSQAVARPDSAAARTFSLWSDTEARERVCRLLRTGWRPDQLAAMFGVSPSEIERLFAWDLDRDSKAVREVAADQFEQWQTLDGVGK